MSSLRPWPPARPGPFVRTPSSRASRSTPSQLHVLRQLCGGLPGDRRHGPAERRAVDLGRRQGIQRADAAAFSRLAIPYLPNHPPRWPEVVERSKHLVEVWRAKAKPGERMGEWIERIGWERFFQVTGIPFTDKHIDDFTHATTTFRATTQFRF